MSGFVAVINTDGAPVERRLLEDLSASLYFRGPDRQQVWTGGPVGLGHALFATTEQARLEQQPASLDGRTWITGCIRVDAREELVGKLGLQRDIRLAETPDSHLVLHAYARWGGQFLQHLLGDFSFALWDSVNNKLLCARDRFGLRQLYYARRGHTVVASNSLDCVRRYPGITEELCEQAIGDFLLFGDHRWGNRSLTAFADIMALEPANCLEIEHDQTRTRRYWDAPTDPQLLYYRNESEYIEHFTQVFGSAVSDRLRTPDIVISFSGGMDSTSVAALARQLQQRQHRASSLHATTVLYDSIHPSAERLYIEAAARELGLQPAYLDGGAYPLLGQWIQTTCPLELYQPRLWLDLERLSLTHGRVLLTGDGGDELFVSTTVRQAAGDTGVLKALATWLQLRWRYGRAPSFGSGLGVGLRRLRDRCQNAQAPYPYPGWLNPDFERKLGLEERWAAYWRAQRAVGGRRGEGIARAMTAPDWNTDDLFMNCGGALPEKRCPFLDPRVMDLVMSVPALPWTFNKHLLRRAMEGKLPAKILQRPKTALGDIQNSLLAVNTPRFEGGYKPSTALSRFITTARMGALSSNEGDSGSRYVNLRPFLLNAWMANLRD